MAYLPNILSLLRIPLAFLFLSTDLTIRLTAVVLAMITDVLDGFLARRYRTNSQMGALIDPLADKFFMLVVLCIVVTEGGLTTLQMAAMLSRDVAVASFGVYLWFSGRWQTFQIRAILAGKASTALQFYVLMSLLLGWPIPDWLFGCLVALGVVALAELCYRKDRPAYTSD
jgi:CDP-diacylglycerol--glycerol-3-phosphate 3-phosphatidyltransferase